MSRTYTVALPVKAHVKKYIASIEGDPILYDSKSLICKIIRPYLENRPKSGLSRHQINVHLATRCHEIKILIPEKKMWFVGHHIQPGHLVLVNRILEDLFESALIQFVNDFVKQEGRYRGYKEAYYAFADLHNIVLDDDISFDGLKKIDQRYRGKKGVKIF